MLLSKYNGDVFALNRIGVVNGGRFIYYVKINSDFLYISSGNNNLIYQWKNLVRNWGFLKKKKWVFQYGFHGYFIPNLDWFLIFKRG